MTIIDRMRFLMFGKIPRSKASRLVSENPLARIILAALGMGRQAIWTPKRYDQLSEAGYQNCMTVYACVNQVARAAAGVEWKAFVDEKDMPKHAILALLNRPNENEGKRSFIAKYFSYLLLAGNDYMIAGRIGAQPPLALWLARPDRMTILPGTGGALVDGYTYTVAGKEQDFNFAEVMHSRLFHPTNDFYGLSPLEVAGRGVDVINMTAQWNMRLLQNDMRPPGALSTEATLNQTAFDRLKAMMKDEWSGYDNAGKPLLLEGGLKWTGFAINPKDLDWLNSTKLTKRDICTVFNVDPCLIGDAEYATYSNKQEARKGLYMETVIPLMYELRDNLDRWLCPMFGPNVRLDIDREKIEALQEEREKKFTYLNAADWLTVNEKRKATGYEEVPGGEVILVSVAKIPLEIAGESAAKPASKGLAAKGEKNAALATPAPKTRALPANSDNFWAVPERKKRLWQTYEARVKAREKSFERMAQGYLRAQADALRQKIARFGSIGGFQASDIFSVNEEAKRYARTFKAWYADNFIRAGNAGMRASKGELFDDGEFKSIAWKGDPKKPTSWDFELTPVQEEKLMQMVFNSGTKVNEMTISTIYDILQTAQADNWTVSQFGQFVYDKVNDFSRWRAQLWARTESAKVDNYGAVEGFKETEFVELKGWMCSFVPESRESHMAADGQEVALEDDFSVGGQPMAFPGDPKGDAGEVCNCFPASTLIDVPAPIFAGTLRRYRGKMIEIITRDGNRLSGTPNHPILTDRGWIPLRLLVKGQNVISCGRGKEMSFSDPNINDNPSAINEIFNSMSAVGSKETIIDSNVNFHGDGMNGNIDIISSNRFLKDGAQTAFPEHLPESHFTRTDFNQGFLPGNGSFAKFLFGDRLRSSGNVGGKDHSLSGFWAEVTETDLNGIAHRPDYNAMLIEKPINDCAVDPAFLSQLFDSNLSGLITPDEIISVREFDFAGHVYNLQNKVGWYIANNIITHNCLCGTYPVVGAAGGE